MKWFAKWLTNQVRNYEACEEKVCGGNQPVAVGMIDEFGPAMNITMYNATGGKIIKFHNYDRKRDRTNETVYIIHPDELLSEALTKLIVMEDLKRV